MNDRSITFFMNDRRSTSALFPVNLANKFLLPPTGGVDRALAELSFSEQTPIEGQPGGIWNPIRYAIGSDPNRGGCILWTSLAFEILSKASTLKGVIQKKTSLPGKIHYWLEAQVPPNNIFEIDASKLQHLFRDRPGLIIRLEILRDCFGYLSGNLNERSVLDGTAPQFFHVPPASVQFGYYGRREHAPAPLREMYNNSLPISLSKFYPGQIPLESAP